MFTRHVVRPITTVAHEEELDRKLDALEWAAARLVPASVVHGLDYVSLGDAARAQLAGEVAVSLLKADDTPLTRRGLRALVNNLYRRITEATTPAMRQAYRRAGRYLTERWPGLTPGQREDVVGEVVERMRADFIAAAIPTAPIVGDAVERTIAATRQATAARHRLTIPQVFTAADASVADHARAAHAIYVRDQLGAIVTGPLADVVRSTIARGLEEGVDGHQIGRDLEKLLAGTGAERTRAYHAMVARTAVTRARTYGVLSSFRSASITRYEVVAVRDEHCCPICYFMHGRTFDVGPALDRFLAAAAAPPEDVGLHQPFMGVARIAGELHVGVRTVGGFVPVAGYSPPATPTGDRIFTPRVADSAIQGLGAGPPPYHPNCRCTLIASFARAVQVPATLPTAAPSPVMSDAARQRAGLAPTPIGRFQVQVIGGRPRVGPPPDLLSPADAAAEWSTHKAHVDPLHLEAIFGPRVPKLRTILDAYSDPDNGLVAEASSAWVSARTCNVSFLLKDRTGRVMTLEPGSRDFRRENGRLVVHNNLLRVFEDAPKGTAERLTRNSMALYTHLGVDTVEVDAAWTGRYTWATFGFRWDDATAQDRAVLFEAFLQRHGVPATEARAAAAATRGAPWLVARFDHHGKTAEHEFHRVVRDTGSGRPGMLVETARGTLGKAFLLQPNASMWSGEVDLTHPDSPSWRRVVDRTINPRRP